MENFKNFKKILEIVFQKLVYLPCDQTSHNSSRNQLLKSEDERVISPIVKEGALSNQEQPSEIAQT